MATPQQTPKPSWLHRLRSRFQSNRADRGAGPDVRRPESASDAEVSAPTNEFDELRAAFHTDDPFSELRQSEQLQRMLERYQRKNQRSD